MVDLSDFDTFGPIDQRPFEVWEIDVTPYSMYSIVNFIVKIYILDVCTMYTPLILGMWYHTLTLMPLTVDLVLTLIL